MSDLSIEIEGMAELNKVLSDIAKKYPQQVLKGCADAGLLIEREAKKNETAVDTGNLRSSISTHINKDEGEVTVTAGGSAGTGEGQTKDVQYATYIEFGTRYMPGLFFMTRAAEVGFRQLPDLVKKAIDGN